MASVPNGTERTKWRRNIAENFIRLSRVHQRYRQTTDRRQTTDGRTMTYSEHELEFTFAKNRLIINRVITKIKRVNFIETQYMFPHIRHGVHHATLRSIWVKWALKNGTEKFVELLITWHHIVKSWWSLVSWCTMGPRRLQKLLKSTFDQIQDGGQRPNWKWLNCLNSIQDCPILRGSSWTQTAQFLWAIINN